MCWLLGWWDVGCGVWVVCVKLLSFTLNMHKRKPSFVRHGEMTMTKTQGRWPFSIRNWL